MMDRDDYGRPGGLSSLRDGAVPSPPKASIPDAGKVLMTHAGPSGRGFEIGLMDGEEGGVLHVLAAGLADMMQLDSDKPLNAVQMEVQPAGKPTLLLTMERRGGKPPLAQKAEAIRLLKQALEAIESGRSEPLFIMRDAIRNWLEDDITAQAMETRPGGDAKAGSVRKHDSAVRQDAPKGTPDD